MNDQYIPTEDEEQAMLIQWRDLNAGMYPELKNLFSVPNGGYRAKATAVLMKATGLTAGVPDLFLAVARHGCHGLWIEMKRIKGGRLSVAQATMIERLSHEGYRCAVCHGFEEARAEILDYLREAQNEDTDHTKPGIQVDPDGGDGECRDSSQD